MIDSNILVTLNMKTCGVEISNREARLCIVEADDEGTPQAVVVKTKKLKLDDEKAQADLKSFLGALRAFVQENNISMMVVKSRASSGNFAAGATSFKIEAIIQLADGVDVTFVHPTQLARFAKTNMGTPPASIPAYLHTAFQVGAYSVTKGTK